MSPTATPFVVPPVEKSVLFDGDVEHAFRRFVDEIGRWWPLATHSMGQNPDARLGFERIEPGGRLIERAPDGAEYVWGTILACERPRLLRFSWHVGRDEDTAQTIEVSFEPRGERTTAVRLTHSGWERLGEQGAATRENYNNGWVLVLERFTNP